MPTTKKQSLWEILVPTHDNEGQKYPLEHHQEWDGFVQDLCGGQTLLKVARGRWVDPATNVLYDETMIPVRIACTKQQIKQIGRHTLEHYNQIAVLAYRISKEVLLFQAPEQSVTLPQTPYPLASYEPLSLEM